MNTIATTVLLFATAILMPGIINRTRALCSGRKGVRLFQHIYNVKAGLSKGTVTGYATSAVTRIAPSVYLGSIVTAALFVPAGNLPPLLHFEGDVVMFAYLLALSRLTLIIAALDTGSSFQGMGASREALYGAMIEPVIFLIGGTLALVSGYTGFEAMFSSLNTMGLTPQMCIAMLLMVYVLVNVIIIECGRVPVDDPHTHLELTMIHEVMILDYSGPDLAIITLGSWVKMAVFGLLAGNIMAAIVGAGTVTALATAALCAVGIGIAESFIARNKLSRNTTFIVTVTAIALVLFMAVFILRLNIKIG